MGKFKEYLNEARIHRAIFGFKGSKGIANGIKLKLFDFCDDYDTNDFVTVEDVTMVDGDDVYDNMFHVIGANQYPEAKWKQLVKAIEKRFDRLEFERFA